jgi:hypothetical protein
LFCATRVPFPGEYKYLIKNGLCLDKEEWLPKSVETEIEHYRIWKWMAAYRNLLISLDRSNKGGVGVSGKIRLLAKIAVRLSNAWAC